MVRALALVVVIALVLSLGRVFLVLGVLFGTAVACIRLGLIATVVTGRTVFIILHEAHLTFDGLSVGGYR